MLRRKPEVRHVILFRRPPTAGKRFASGVVRWKIAGFPLLQVRLEVRTHFLEHLEVVPTSHFAERMKTTRSRRATALAAARTCLFQRRAKKKKKTEDEQRKKRKETKRNEQRTCVRRAIVARDAHQKVRDATGAPVPAPPLAVVTAENDKIEVLAHTTAPLE